MAVSKNNRRKKRKRTQNHSAPVIEKHLTEAEVQELEHKQQQENKRLKWSIIFIVIMIGGFVIARAAAAPLIGYPISFIGGIGGLATTRTQEKGKTVTVICYTIYCILVAYMWIYQFLAN